MKATSAQLIPSDDTHYVTPKGVSELITKEVYKIGDIIYSPILKGTNWRFCDGSALNRNSYPALYSVIRDRFGLVTKDVVTGSIITTSNGRNYTYSRSFSLNGYMYFFTDTLLSGFNSSGTCVYTKTSSQWYPGYVMVQPISTNTAIAMAYASGYIYVYKFISNSDGTITLSDVGNLKVSLNTPLLCAQYGEAVYMICGSNSMGSTTSSVDIVCVVGNNISSLNVGLNSGALRNMRVVYWNGIFYLCVIDSSQSDYHYFTIDVRVFGTYTLGTTIPDNNIKTFLTTKTINDSISFNGINAYSIAISTDEIRVLSFEQNTTSLKIFTPVFNQLNMPTPSACLGSMGEQKACFLSKNEIIVWRDFSYYKTSGTQSTTKIYSLGVINVTDELPAFYTNAVYSDTAPAYDSFFGETNLYACFRENTNTKTLTPLITPINLTKFRIPGPEYLPTSEINMMQIKIS